MRTFRDAKAMAKTLRVELKTRRDVDLTHSECLEIVARELGHDSWNVLSAKIDELGGITGDGHTGPSSAANTTIPVLRVFSVPLARTFYVDWLGCTLDWGGPAGGPGSNFFGQVTRAGTTLHLTEATYDPYPGATIGVWMQGLDGLVSELNTKRDRVKVMGPAVFVPDPQEVSWGARMLTLTDPFGNAFRFTEPLDPHERAALPSWGQT